MKRTLKIGLMSCLAAAFLFSGCKKDDDSAPEVKINILPKKVKQIVTYDIDTTEGRYYSHAYNFLEDGKVDNELTTSKVLIVDSTYENIKRYEFYQYTSSYIYRTNYRIEYEQGNAYDLLHSTLYNIDNGRVSSYLTTQGKNGLPQYGEGNGICRYSSEGYISEKEYVSKDDPKSKTITKYNIEDGILTSMVTTGSSGNTYSNVLFTYNSKVVNNLNVNLWFLIFDTPPFEDYFGKRFQYLPSTTVEEIIKEYSYEYDGEYLKKITQTNYVNGTLHTVAWEISYY